MIIVFTMVSVSIKYLGKESYGIWVVLSGMFTWANVADLGMSHGLRNRLAEERAKGNLEIGRYYVSTTYAYLIATAIILVVIFIPLIYYINWNFLLNTTYVSNETLEHVALIIVFLFIIQFILRPIGSIVEAFQWPSINHLIGFHSSAISLVAIYYLVCQTGKGALSIYAYIIGGVPIIVLLLISIYLFRQKFPDLSPSVKYVTRSYLKKIAGLGLSFFVIQLSVIIIFQSDNMIISYLFGPDEVTNYNITYRYFSIVISIFVVIIAPFWTAFTDAYHKNDFIWIKKIMRMLLLMASGIGIIAMLLYLISDNVFHLWIDERVSIPKSLSGLMACYVVLMCFHIIFSTFSNGIGKIKIQLWAVTIAATMNLPLSYYFGKLSGLGPSGVLLATISCMIFVDVLLLFQYFKIIDKKAIGIWDK